MAGAREPSHASGIQHRCHRVQAAVCVVGGGSGVVVVMTHKRGDGFVWSVVAAGEADCLTPLCFEYTFFPNADLDTLSFSF